MSSQALLHSRRFGLNLRAALLIVFWCLTAAASVTAQTPAATPSPDATREDRQLTEARRQNEEAQAEYYKAQTKKLNEPVPEKSFWRTLSDNAAILGALTAALVALFTLIVNQRTALRARKDTEFYEALKRFGDKDSPTVRASAAAILMEMSDVTFFAWRWRNKGSWWRLDQKMIRYPYFETVLDQLITGLLIEENSVVVRSIVTSLKRILPRDFKRSTRQLRNANLKLQEDMATYMMQFYVAKGVNDVNQVEAEVLEEASSLTTCPKEGLRAILGNFGGWWSWDALFVALEAYKLVAEDERRPHLIELQNKLADVGRRLSQNVALCSKLFEARPAETTERLYFRNAYLANASLMKCNLRGIDFTQALLPRAHCAEAKLAGASLEGAFLHRADLSSTELTDTKLYSAEIDSPRIFYQANWWQADFAQAAGPDDVESSLPETKIVDSKLLDRLLSHWGELSPERLKTAHKSVKTYIAVGKPMPKGLGQPQDSNLAGTA